MATSSDLMPALPLDLALECLLRVPLHAHSTLQQVCTSWRALLSSPSFFAARLSKGFTHSQACIIQAQPASPSCKSRPSYGLSLFDSKLLSWSSLPSLPPFPHGLPLFCSCVAVGPRLILLGGWDPSSYSVLTSVYIYDFSSSLWRLGSPMPSPRSFFACARSGLDKIVIAGGHDHNKTALKSAAMYDVQKDVWESLPDMSQERDECKAVFLKGKLIVVSGFSTESQGQFGRSAEIFDMVERRWVWEENFWAAGQAPSSIVAFRDQLYALLDGNLVRHKAPDSTWEPVLALPSGMKTLACVTSLQGGILVVGSRGAAQPFSTFLCRMGMGYNTPTWQEVKGNACCAIVPQQTACTIEV